MRPIHFVCFVVACLSVGGGLQSEAYVDDPEAYRVYASLLPREWTVTAAHAKTLVFQQETTTNRGCMPKGGALDTEWKPVVDNFRSANETVKLLRPGFATTPPYVVAPSATIRATFNTVANDPMFGLSGFYNAYPDSGGYMMVSAVGFSLDRTRAMVYMAHSCGSLCGGGTHHLLEKVDGAWREAVVPGMQNCSWVS